MISCSILNLRRIILHIPYVYLFGSKLIRLPSETSLRGNRNKSPIVSRRILRFLGSIVLVDALKEENRKNVDHWWTHRSCQSNSLALTENDQSPIKFRDRIRLARFPKSLNLQPSSSDNFFLMMPSARQRRR